MRGRRTSTITCSQILRCHLVASWPRFCELQFLPLRWKDNPSRGCWEGKHNTRLLVSTSYGVATLV